MELSCGMTWRGAPIASAKHDDLTYGSLAYFEVRSAAGIRYCAALCNGRSFGRSGTRSGSGLTPGKFAASVHLFLVCGICLDFLLCMDGTLAECSRCILFS